MKYTNDTFIEKAISVHGNKYDYSLVEYINSNTKIKIICPIHGIFEQEPSSHLRGYSCSWCGNSKKYTNDIFIEKAKQVHGNKYDYSLVNYVNSHTKIKIICPIHGIFEQMPYSHLNYHNCPLCKGVSRNTNDIFIEKAKQVHGNKYDYSLVEYINNKTKIKIICPVHDIFEQEPSSHLNGSECPYCRGWSTQKHSNESFIEKAISVHGNKYDYSLVEYINSNTKIKIICNIHGIFEQIPQSHLNGSGCQTCFNGISKQELELRDFVSSVYKDKIITNDRSIISPYELDIYLPDINLAFEYNGDYWHQEGINKPIGYHQMKTDMCNTKGITLLHIWEKEWILDNDKSLELIHKLIKTNIG